MSDKTVLIIGLIVLVLIAAYGERAWIWINCSLWPKEKPEKVNGKKVRIGEFDGIGENPPKQLIGTISSCLDESYRIDFDVPFVYDGKTEHYAIVRARHAGYPVSRMGKTSILAVNGSFESGTPFISLIAKM